jgi:hypothetical protein
MHTALLLAGGITLLYKQRLLALKLSTEKLPRMKAQVQLGALMSCAHKTTTRRLSMATVQFPLIWKWIPLRNDRQQVSLHVSFMDSAVARLASVKHSLGMDGFALYVVFYSLLNEQVKFLSQTVYVPAKVLESSPRLAVQRVFVNFSLYYFFLLADSVLKGYSDILLQKLFRNLQIDCGQSCLKKSITNTISLDVVHVILYIQLPTKNQLVHPYH